MPRRRASECESLKHISSKCRWKWSARLLKNNPARKNWSSRWSCPNGEQELLSSPRITPPSAVSRREETTMSDGQFEFPEWQAPLEELILEFDRTKLPEKLQVAETAIYGRLQQLGLLNNGHREH